MVFESILMALWQTQVHSSVMKQENPKTKGKKRTKTVAMDVFPHAQMIITNIEKGPLLTLLRPS